MAEETKIQWTDHSWSPWIGCSKVSAGCANCYAEHLMDTRLGRVEWGPQGTRSRTSGDYWKSPLDWDRKAARDRTRFRVFPSLCDPFEDFSHQRTDDLFENDLTKWRGEFWKLIGRTPNLDWLLLTKRPENVAHMVPSEWLDAPGNEGKGDWPSNVWLGVSVENQETADQRIPHLLEIPAKLRFLSVEPLLGPIQFPLPCRDSVFWSGVHWVIIGGESGAGARPCTIGHIREIVQQCQSASVPVFVKQLGAKPVNREGVPHPTPTDPKKGGYFDEFPQDLQVREAPKEVTA